MFFWNSCCFDDPEDVGNLISGSSACQISILYTFNLHIICQLYPNVSGNHQHQPQKYIQGEGKKKIPKSHRDHLIPPPHVAQDRLPGSCSYPCEFEFMWGTEVQVEFSGWNICSPRFKAKTITTTTKKTFSLVLSPNPTYFNI